MDLFTPHGNHSFQVNGNTVINKPRGQFNVEGVEAAWEAILKTVEKLKLERWYLIEYLHKELMSTFETEETLIKYYNISRERGCQYVCLIADCSDIEKHHVARAIQKSHLNGEVVQDLPSALTRIEFLKGAEPGRSD